MNYDNILNCKKSSIIKILPLYSSDIFKALDILQKKYDYYHYIFEKNRNYDIIVDEMINNVCRWSKINTCIRYSYFKEFYFCLLPLIEIHIKYKVCTR
jgi:hypothetical protein